MLRKSISKGLLMTALITSSVVSGSTAVFAEESLNEYTLDTLVVTATRTEKRDVDVPATTEILSSERLQETGATTLEGAIKYTTGIVYKAETIGDNGGEFLVRGKRRGTLVMVDGVPMNFRTGYYDLDTINIADVEKVEIVRGGGAVLYGSDASGGVINIITKKKRTNSISVAVGDNRVQKYQTSLQVGKLGVGASWTKKGSVDRTSMATNSKGGFDPNGNYFKFYGGEKTILSTKYVFDEHWKMTFDYNNYDYARGYMSEKTNLATDKRFINRKENKITLNYDNDGWKATAFYHKGSSDSRYHYWKGNKFYPNSYFYGNDDVVKGVEVTKDIELDKNNNLLVGAKAYNEKYNYYREYIEPYYSKYAKKYPPLSYDYDRNVYSVFAQLDHKFDDRHDVIIGARETWTGSSPDGTNYNEFTPQIQYSYKMTENTSAYASVGKSFTLPTLTDMYGKDAVIQNTAIKPEVGLHYETGLKHISGDHSWKLALFKSDVKDFVTDGEDKDGNSIAINEDTKNMGIELSCEMTKAEGLSYNWGVSFSNPQYRTPKEDNDAWKRNYGRWLLNGGVNYNKDKFNVALNASMMADRVLQKYQIPVKPYLYTSLYIAYKPVKEHEIYLNVDNLLDRHDITSHVLSRYVSLGRNFEVGYRFTF